MMDASRGIGSAGQSGAVGGVSPGISRESSRNRPAVAIGAGLDGATPNGPRGRRMLSPNTPVESLDHMAPRGTYLDILI